MRESAATALPAPEALAERGVSVIVRVTERPAALEALYREYAPAVEALGRPFEFVFAIEPGARGLTEPLRSLIAAGEPIRILEFAGSIGEANLLRFAGERSHGRVIVTLPAYYRVGAEALPRLINEVDGGADLAMARRWPRADGRINRLQSRAFNAILRKLIGQPLHDVACGVQAMRREVLEGSPLYGDFFRFLPVLAGREGFRVVEIEAAQHPRDRRTRVYSPGMYLRRLIDIFGLFFLVRFTEKPLRFFGLIGGAAALVGAIVLGILFVQRQFGGQPLASRPMLLVGILAFSLGIQAIALGLIGEIIVHLHAASTRRYRVLEEPEADW
ncbi:MAG: hypothetical protein ACRELC_09790 [Gemmatimonadota bacterium]